MKPAIIMTQTMVAAAARRLSSVRLASSTSSDVPAAPTPTPIRPNAATASAIPNSGCVVIHAVATDAIKPPVARTAMPPTIHGVRRAPRSEPWPQAGRNT